MKVFPTVICARLVYVWLLATGFVASSAGAATLPGGGLVSAWGWDGDGQTHPPANLNNVTAISAGLAHTAALKSDGTVVAWGNNWQGQTTIPAGLAGALAVAAGGFHTVALRPDGSVAAWGANGDGQTTVPAGLGGVTAITAGYYHTAALRSDGTVVVWGRSLEGQTEVPELAVGVKAIAAGGYHIVALKQDGTVIAWGRNLEGQTSVPTGLSGVIAIAGGGYHTVALKSDGAIIAWGRNLEGQTTVPDGLRGVTSLAAGGYHTVALTSDGGIVAWGQSQYGQTKTPAGLGKTVAIAAGFGHTVARLEAGATLVEPAIDLLEQPANAVAGQTLKFKISVTGVPSPAIQWQRSRDNGATWENLLDGDEFLGVTTGTLTILQATVEMSGHYFRPVASNTAGSATGSFTRLTVTAPPGLGNVIAWGDNAYGQATVPAGLTGVIAVSAGEQHTLALRGDGTVAGWGSDQYGQSIVPASLRDVKAIAAGGFHSVALKNDGSVTLWGSNIGGIMNPPAGLGGVIAITAGRHNTAVLKSDGTVVVWGLDDYGQTKVPAGLGGVTAITAGGQFIAALKSDGTVVAWGENAVGETNVPAGLSQVRAIAAGVQHILALKNDGTVVAWGDNSQGQLNVPPGLTGVTAVASHFFLSLALKSDGTLVAWGKDEHHQIAVASQLRDLAAVRTGDGHCVAILGQASRGVAPMIVTDPADATVFPGLNATFSAVTYGSPAPALRWQRSTDGGQAWENLTEGSVFNGVTSEVLRVDSLAATILTGNRFRLVASSSQGVIASRPVLLTVTRTLPPVINQQPVDRLATAGQGVTFIAAAAGIPRPEVRWQRSTDSGATWKDLIEGDAFSGVSTGSLRVSPVTTAMQDHQFRMIATNEASEATSAPARLTVKPPPAGRVIVWGNGRYGPANVPVGLSGATAVATGANHVLALKNDGQVVAWGDNNKGQATVPTSLGAVRAIAASQQYSLALKNDGTVAFWGDNASGLMEAPPGLTNVTAIAAGYFHSLALKNDGRVVSWGFNTEMDRPLAIPADLDQVTAIGAGVYHAAALRSDGTVAVWGDNQYGQTEISPGLKDVVAIAVGGFHTVGLKRDGTVVAWGDDRAGQTAVPAGLRDVKAIAAGESFTLALKHDGTVVAWGDDEFLQVSIARKLTSLSSVAAGTTYALGLLEAGSLGIPPVIVVEPADLVMAAPDEAVFNAAAYGYPAPDFRWQRSLDGGVTWADLAEGFIFNGVKAEVLKVGTKEGTVNGSFFRLTATSSLGRTLSTPAQLLVTAPVAPVIVRQPADQEVKYNAQATFSAAAAGVSPPELLWQRSADQGVTWENLSDGYVFKGANTGKLVLLAATLEMEGHQFRLSATNRLGGTVSAGAVLHVTRRAVPYFTGYPGPQSIFAGTALKLTCQFEGDPRATIRWYYSADRARTWTTLQDGPVFTGTRTTTLSINPVTLEMNGHWLYALVGNAWGSAATGIIELAVRAAQPLVIQRQPADQTLVESKPTVFSALVEGAPVLAFQWQRSTNSAVTWENLSDGHVFKGASTDTLTLLAASLDMDRHMFRLSATNTLGGVVSAGAMLHVTKSVKPYFEKYPGPQPAYAGAPLSITCPVGGDPQPSIQWERSTDGGKTWKALEDGGGVAGAQSSTVTIDPVTQDMNGDWFRVSANNLGGGSTGDVIPLTVSAGQAPIVKRQPADQSVVEFGPAFFSALIEGLPAPALQWQYSTNGGAIWRILTPNAAYSGVTDGTLNLPSAVTNWSGYQFRLTATNRFGEAASAPANLTVASRLLPVITSNPVDQQVGPGQTARFTSAFQSPLASPRLHWQSSTNEGGTWFNLADGGGISGVGTTNLVLAVVTRAMNNQWFRLTVTNAIGGRASAAAKLTVTDTLAPVFNQSPAPQSAIVGQPVVFSVSVLGSPQPTLRWQQSTDAGRSWADLTDGTNIVGTTNSTLRVQAVTSAMSGHQFRVIASNTAGTTVSQAATLTVRAGPQPGVLQFTRASYTVREGVGTITLAVSRTIASEGAVAVAYVTANGLATAPDDYRAATGTLVWAAGSLDSKAIVLAVTDDLVPEDEETFTVSLIGPTGGATLGSIATTTISISDDDAKAPELMARMFANFGGFTLKGTTGATYQIDYTDTLSPPLWKAAGTVTLQSAEQPWVDGTSATTPARFYRAVVQP